MSPDFTSLPYVQAQYKIVTTYFAANATTQQCLRPNQNRVALHFCDSVGNINIGLDSTVTANANVFYTLSSTFLERIMTFSNYGPLVGNAFWCVRLSGASTLTLVEIIYVPTS